MDEIGSKRSAAPVLFHPRWMPGTIWDGQWRHRGGKLIGAGGGGFLCPCATNALRHALIGAGLREVRFRSILRYESAHSVSALALLAGGMGHACGRYRKIPKSIWM